MIDFLKQYWFIIVFVFSLGGWVTTIQIKLDKVDTKLDKEIFYGKIKDDSIKTALQDYRDSIQQVKDRELDSIENWYERRFATVKSTFDTLTKPAKK